MAPLDTEKIRRTKSMKLKDDQNCQSVCFKKRKSTLWKKASELSVLCGGEVFMVCYGPDKTVETWPENKSEVVELIGKYKALSERARLKGNDRYNPVGFLNEKSQKFKRNKMMITVEEDHREITEKGTSAVSWGWGQRLNRFLEEKLVGLHSNLESKLQELKEKIRVLPSKKFKKEKAAEVHNHQEIGIDE